MTELHPIIAALCAIHEDLPRKGPGCDQASRRLFEVIRPRLPEAPRAADLGCGAGQGAILLAQELNARVTAVDFCPPFIDELTARLQGQDYAHQIEPRVADMREPGLAPGSLDLVWSEGAAYAIGLDVALKAWFDLLAPGGILVLSECCWLGGERPAAAASFWSESYPAMGSTGDFLKMAEATGLHFVAAETLDRAAWIDNYYQPLSARMDAMEDQRKGNPALSDVMHACRREIEVFHRSEGAYGYVLAAFQRPA